jgi:hypothetical protein
VLYNLVTVAFGSPGHMSFLNIVFHWCLKKFGEHLNWQHLSEVRIYLEEPLPCTLKGARILTEAG